MFFIFQQLNAVLLISIQCSNNLCIDRNKFMLLINLDIHVPNGWLRYALMLFIFIFWTSQINKNCDFNQLNSWIWKLIDLDLLKFHFLHNCFWINVNSSFPEKFNGRWFLYMMKYLIYSKNYAIECNGYSMRPCICWWYKITSVLWIDSMLSFNSLLAQKTCNNSLFHFNLLLLFFQ